MGSYYDKYYSGLKTIQIHITDYCSDYIVNYTNRFPSVKLATPSRRIYSENKPHREWQAIAASLL